MAHISECQICQQPLVDSNVCPECQKQIRAKTFKTLEELRKRRQEENSLEDLQLALADLRESLRLCVRDPAQDDLLIGAST